MEIKSFRQSINEEAVKTLSIRVRFFDDHMDNLTTFKALGKKMPDVDFEAWHVKPNGIPHRV